LIIIDIETCCPKLRNAYLSPTNPNGKDHIYRWMEKELKVKLEYKKTREITEAAANIVFKSDADATMFLLKWGK